MGLFPPLDKVLDRLLESGLLAKDVDGAKATFARVVRTDLMEDETALFYDQSAHFLVGFA